MFRTSPYYTNVRQEVYAEINYQLSQELDQMQQQKDHIGSNSKKSASKQTFNSICRNSHLIQLQSTREQMIRNQFQKIRLSRNVRTVRSKQFPRTSTVLTVLS
ncbi:unnamed protein product (macronuclear) [Paramecium tetraurelia]|uniref:Uncharacterized protein n=1 Tax=Paramecium tetraurelia TaxID=5888 RepID=A0DDR3_PARTE|nr:uncharacterized protein GSPATT00016021001 [Paramecium tetraurelia]CAK81180.1 unnamed protein product [Paramecium tetraurelia]|eukprot:XP_001448577.1 hypothetical protein (macronuclear) [Paramecium tetraurelia strain d4-2]